MRVLNDRGKEITDRGSWERLAAPVSGSQWKQDRSAAELAREWIEGDGPARAEALLSAHPELGNVTLDSAIAEKRTHFDDIGRGPRNHDLLVLGTAAPGKIVVGVEGKADESFGETLAQYRAKQRSEASRALERLERLTLGLFGRTIEKDPGLAEIRYQLCSALAGTLADSKDKNAAAAVLLVHEFRTKLTDDRLHDANAEDLTAFMARLRGEAPRHTGTDGWISGPWTIHADGEWLPLSMPVFVAKLVTHLRKTANGVPPRGR